MSITEAHPHSVPALPPDLRLTALRRRVVTSPALALAISDMAYGSRARDHSETLHFTTSARVADAIGVR